MNTTMAMAENAINAMTGNGAVSSVRKERRYVVVTRDSKDDKTNYAFSYPGRINLRESDPVFNSLVLSNGLSPMPMDLHIRKISTHIDWFDTALTRYHCKPAMIYLEVSDGNFIPVMNGDSYIHYIHFETMPITMFKNYNNLLLMLQRMLEDTDPAAENNGVTLYKQDYGNLTVIVEERNFKTVAIRIANKLSEYGDLVLDAIVLGKGKYLLLSTDALARMFDFVDFSDENVDEVSEKMAQDWLHFMDISLNSTAVPSQTPITKDNESSIIQSMNYIIEIVKAVYKGDPNATVTDFTKALRVEMCKYGMPDDTLSEVASCYVKTAYNDKGLPADVIQ